LADLEYLNESGPRIPLARGACFSLGSLFPSRSGLRKLKHAPRWMFP